MFPVLGISKRRSACADIQCALLSGSGRNSKVTTAQSGAQVWQIVMFDYRVHASGYAGSV